MTTVSVTEFETRLHWQGERGATLMTDRAPELPLAGTLSESPEAQWNAEALLVGAVEGRTLLTFLERARAEGLEVLFYQSSAVGRRVDGPDGQFVFTDLIVRPHVAVRSEKDAHTARRIFATLPSRCFPSSVLNITPRIEPIVESWNLGPRKQAPTLEEAVL